MTDDSQLLCQYVDSGSEVAFAELVQRHIAMVYHSAARQLGGDTSLARDVTQSVFVLLVAKSRSLLTHSSLAAWLHATTRFKVRELQRADRRRRSRESTAHFIHELTQNEMSTHEWERLRPMIDDVLLELKESDREAVLLRFFEGMPYAEIAGRLRLTENSAHKRVERALENLRVRLVRRGVKSTATALATVLGSHVALAGTPAGLAASVTGAAISAGVPAVATVSLLSFMSTKATMTAAAVSLVVAGGVATQQVNGAREAADTLAVLEQENVVLAERVRAEEARLARAALATRPTSAAPAAESPSQTSQVARALGTRGFASVEESQAFLRANPDVREALVAYHRDTLAAEFAELIATFGLTDAERERFLAILASGNRRIVGEHQFSVVDTEITGAQITEQLRDLLGETRYQQYREYRGQSLVRNITDELTRALYFTETPLTPNHAAAVKNIVLHAATDPVLGPKYNGGWQYMPKPVWVRVIAEAQATLPTPQVEALREMQERSNFFHAQSEASKAYRAAQAAAKQKGN